MRAISVVAAMASRHDYAMRESYKLFCILHFTFYIFTFLHFTVYRVHVQSSDTNTSTGTIDTSTSTTHAQRTIHNVQRVWTKRENVNEEDNNERTKAVSASHRCARECCPRRCCHLCSASCTSRSRRGLNWSAHCSLAPWPAPPYSMIGAPSALASIRELRGCTSKSLSPVATRSDRSPSRARFLSCPSRAYVT